MQRGGLCGRLCFFYINLQKKDGSTFLEYDKCTSCSSCEANDQASNHKVSCESLASGLVAPLAAPMLGLGSQRRCAIPAP